MPEPLTAQQIEVLEFERLRWRYLGARETAIRERFRWSPTRHAQVVNHLIDQPAAMDYDPATVTRLRRLRDRRAQQRTASRLGFDVAGGDAR